MKVVKAAAVQLSVAAMVRADERLEAEFPLLKLPVLILHGSSDKATKPSGSQLFYDTAGSPDKTLKLYEGHFHDLLNDVGKERVMSDVTGWIEAHLAPTREGSARASRSTREDAGERAQA